MKRCLTNMEFEAARRESRLQPLSELYISYEGGGKEIPIHIPDISLHGMFVNTSTHFPEGSVLNLRFRLTRSNIEVQTRGEVRYCIPGVGIGVEFIGIEPETVEAIAVEIKASPRPRPRRT